MRIEGDGRPRTSRTSGRCGRGGGIHLRWCLGQIPFGAIELRVGTEARTDADALREHCRTMLTPDEVPDRVFVVEALPRGAALKVDRRWLLTMLQDLGAKQKHIHVKGIRP